MDTRTQAMIKARGWLGTPYHHQASLRGVGCDCLGLLRGIWRELYGAEPEIAPAYTPDWAEATGEETLFHAARRNLVELPDKHDAQPGDVILFRMQTYGPAKHVGLLVAPDKFIHAYSGRAVTQSSLSRWWDKKWVASFTWPPTLET